MFKDSISNVITAAEKLGQKWPWEMDIKLRAIFLGAVGQNGLFEIEIKTGDKFGWLFVGEHKAVIFDFGGMRYWIKTTELRAIVDEDLKQKKYSDTPKAGHLLKLEGNILGYLDPERVVSKSESFDHYDNR